MDLKSACIKNVDEKIIGHSQGLPKMIFYTWLVDRTS